MKTETVYYGKIKTKKYGTGKFIFSLAALMNFLKTQSFIEVRIMGKKYKEKAKKTKGGI